MVEKDNTQNSNQETKLNAGVVVLIIIFAFLFIVAAIYTALSLQICTVKHIASHPSPQMGRLFLETLFASLCCPCYFVMKIMQGANTCVFMNATPTSSLQ